MLNIESIESLLNWLDNDMVTDTKTLKPKELSTAQNNVISEYISSKRFKDTDTIIFNEVIFEDNYKDMLQFLKELEVKEILISNSSSELMDLLYFLLENNCKVLRSETLKRVIWADEYESIKALRVQL